MIVKHDPKDFLSILGKVVSMIGEAPLIMDADGLRIATLDKAHIMMYYLRFPPEYFDEYGIDEYVIGINGLDLSKIITKFKGVDTFKMDYNPSSRRLELITISKSKTRKIELNTMDLDGIDILSFDQLTNLRNINFNILLECDLGEFVDEVDLIQLLTDDQFTLKADKDQFAIITSDHGLYGSGGSILKNINNYECKSDIVNIGTFSYSFIAKLRGFKTEIKNLKIGFSNDTPLWIVCMNDEFEFEVFLAPVVPLEDDYNEDDE